jgi:hypothetical protein
MKKATNFHRILGLLIIPLMVSCLVFTPWPAAAQYDPYPEASERFSREELAQLLAPVALYPDTLLSQILMASTYPIEVVEADRWVSKYPGLQGEALGRALLNMDWDPSVMAICHFPSILALMSERIAETSDLGNAFLAQEPEVMAMIQELRAAALAQGNLSTTAQQLVIVERETIIIEPANPRVIYVPYYDPFYVYGPWWYPAYPPYYWGPPGVSVGFGIAYWPGTSFSFVFGNWSTFDWHRHTIFIDVHKRPKFVRHDRWVAKPGPWQHAPVHRRGVAYRDTTTAGKYGQPFKRVIDGRRDTRDVSGSGSLVRERDRRLEDRPRRDLDRRGEDRSRLERNRQAPHPGDPERQLRERSERQRQEQARVERDRQARERSVREQAEPDRQRRQLLERERQAREGAERDRQSRVRVEREQRERQRIDRERPGRQRLEGERQLRQRAEQSRPPQERAERGKQQRSRDPNLSQVQAGKKKQGTNESGQFKRQGAEDDGRGSDRSGSDRRGDRDNRGGNRR